MAKDTRSPLKAKPLRSPGQSLDEEIQKVLEEDVLTYYWMAGGFVLLAIMEWLAYIDAIARGENRILLVMATGTGKTFTAFQIIWRLWKSGAKKRIL